MKYRIKKAIDWCTLKETFTPQYCISLLWIYIPYWADFEYNDWMCRYSIQFETYDEAVAYIKEQRCKQCTSFTYYYV